MEAGSADGRLRADVRPARLWKAIELLQRLYLWLLGRRRRVAARRQGLFRLHRRGAEMARPLRPAKYAQSLRPGARGREEPGARSRLRFDSSLDPPQVRPGDALPPDQPDPR